MSKKKRVLLGGVIIFILINIIIGITGLIINFKNINKVIDGDKGAVFEDTSCYFEKTEKENTDNLLGTNIRFATNELLVSANNDVTYEQIEELANSYNAKIVGYIEITGDYQWKLSTRQTEEQLNSLINELEKEDIILSADFNILLKNNLNYEPIDNDWNSTWDESYPNGDNWGLEAINALSAWNNRKQMSEIKVGLFDSAFDTSGSINNYNDDSGNNQHNYTIAKDSSATGNEVTVNNILKYTDEDLNYEGHEDLNFAMTFYNPSHSKQTEILNNLNSNSHSLLTHGSHVAGTMGATFDNGKGISGVYPNAKGNIYGVSVLGLSSFAENISIMSYKCAFAELICRDVKIINVSLAYDGSFIYNTYKNIGTYRKNHELISKELGNFLERLIDKGYDFVIVSSAGNTSNSYFKFNSSNKVYERCSKKDKNSETAVIPCEYNGPLNGIKNEKVKDRIIVVGACKYKYLGFGKFEYYRCEFSNEGERLDVIAPGANIRSTVNGGYESGWQGTSMAAPHVSGIAAMVWSINSNLTGADVKKIVKDSANIDVTNSGRDMINAYRAVNNIDVYKNMAISNDLKNELKNGIAIASVVESADESKKIQGATIKVSDLNGNILDYDKTETDSNGLFELILPEGQYNIVVNAGGYKEYIIKNVNILAGQVSYLEWAKLESELNYTWHLSPTIEAEDIIVSDIEKHAIYGHTANPFDEYSIIKQNGKYRFIKYDGKYISDEQYDKWYFSKPDVITLSSDDNDNEISILGYDDNKIIYKSDAAGWGRLGFFINNKTNDIYYIQHGSYYQYEENNNIVVQSADISIISSEKNQLGIEYNLNINNIGKYGIANNSGLVVDCIYDDACMNIDDNIIALEKNGKWGYLNKDGTQVIDFVCEPFESKILDVMWLHNHDDENVQHPYLSSYSYIPVKINGQCGYYDTQGNEVIPCGTFEEVRPVHNGLAWVKKDGKWGVIELEDIETETTTSTEKSSSMETIDIYEGETITLNGTLSYEHYEINSNNSGEALILTLDKPFIAKYCKSEVFEVGTTENITSVQILSDNLSQFSDGQYVTLTGTIMNAHTGHHIRSIILTDIVDENTQDTNSQLSDSEILSAINKYLEENQNYLGVFLSNSNAYCPAEYMASTDTKWSCPINNNDYIYSRNYIAGSYPYFAFVDKETLICTITANYDTVVEFDLNIGQKANIKNIKIKNIRASSQLEDEFVGGINHTYTPWNINDNDMKTCWCEGDSAHGIGESITIELDSEYLISKICVWNGLCTSEELYKKNSRIHDCSIIFSNGESIKVEFQDGWENRENIILLPDNIKTSSIELVIESVYEGDVYMDTCVSEIKFS